MTPPTRTTMPKNPTVVSLSGPGPAMMGRLAVAAISHRFLQMPAHLDSAAEYSGSGLQGAGWGGGGGGVRRDSEYNQKDHVIVIVSANTFDVVLSQ
jgi:hypothetical protein